VAGGDVFFEPDKQLPKQRDFHIPGSKFTIFRVRNPEFSSDLGRSRYFLLMMLVLSVCMNP
jgi:hypothetical protein